MRYLGLDLGTKTCGVAITDITNTLSVPMKTIEFQKEDYEFLLKEVIKLVEDNNITKVILGLPLNMDGSKGFASQRSINFANMLKENIIDCEFIDERLTSVEAQKILHDNNLKSKNFGKKVDSQAATLILDTYLRKIENENK